MNTEITIHDYLFHFMIVDYKVGDVITTTTSKASTTQGKVMALFFISDHFI